ncbi:MAG TPA: hypothetical protein LFW21_03560 [Rickettsia endosymbiont of Pyrocoelia pectoralis]|nr:hypothetical protein [Rickettsia endosymbiont of Pyrocoelia pectoralis]
MKTVQINNTEIYNLLPENQLLTEGLRQYKLFFAFQNRWSSYTRKAVNLLFESAIENLTCAMLLGEEEAVLPLARLYYNGTIYGILEDLVFGDYIILIGQQLGYKSCQNIPLRIIKNTKYFEKQLDDLAIMITYNMLFYYANFKFISDHIKKKSFRIVISNSINNGIFVIIVTRKAKSSRC